MVFAVCPVPRALGSRLRRAAIETPVFARSASFSSTSTSSSNVPAPGEGNVRINISAPKPTLLVPLAAKRTKDVAVNKTQERPAIGQGNLAPIGVLQRPRRKNERLRHLEILDKVPFEMVQAHEERNAAHRRLHPAPGSIGKILRRYRKDDNTTLLKSMLQACVEKQFEPLLWDTFAEELREMAKRLAPADVGIALMCLVKAEYQRDKDLVVRLVASLAAQAAVSLRSVGPGVSSNVSTSTTDGSPTPFGQGRGRKHTRSVPEATVAAPAPSLETVGRARMQSALNVHQFPEYALVAALSAIQFNSLARACTDDIAKLGSRISRMAPDMADGVISKLAHHAAALASSHPKGRAGPAGRMLCALRPHICTKLAGADKLRQSQRHSEEENVENFTSADLCLLAHAFAQAPLPGANAEQDRPLFEALRNRLDNVVLLQLSMGQISGLANSFGKLQQASKLGHVELFARLGRHLSKTPEGLGLRNACVSLSAFAQASVRHEPLFASMEGPMPAWLAGSGCDTRQLAMVAHAYVRVGLTNCCLLPLVWDRAKRFAPQSDAKGVSVMIFAVTKSSSVGSGSGGDELVTALGKRLLELLQGAGGGIEPATVVVASYALARGGCVHLVDPDLWNVLALEASADKCMGKLSLSELANMASALVTVSSEMPDMGEACAINFLAFFSSLNARVGVELGVPAVSSGCPTVPPNQPPLQPITASKLASAFGHMRCMEARETARQLAYRCLLPGRSPQQSLGIGPLRSLAAAINRLRVYDDDLIQALTTAQRPKVARDGRRR